MPNAQLLNSIRRAYAAQNASLVTEKGVQTLFKGVKSGLDDVRKRIKKQRQKLVNDVGFKERDFTDLNVQEPQQDVINEYYDLYNDGKKRRDVDKMNDAKNGLDKLHTSMYNFGETVNGIKTQFGGQVKNNRRSKYLNDEDDAFLDMILQDYDNFMKKVTVDRDKDSENYQEPYYLDLVYGEEERESMGPHPMEVLSERKVYLKDIKIPSPESTTANDFMNGEVPKYIRQRSNRGESWESIQGTIDQAWENHEKNGNHTMGSLMFDSRTHLEGYLNWMIEHPEYDSEFPELYETVEWAKKGYQDSGWDKDWLNDARVYMESVLEKEMRNEDPWVWESYKQYRNEQYKKDWENSRPGPGATEEALNVKDERMTELMNTFASELKAKGKKIIDPRDKAEYEWSEVLKAYVRVNRMGQVIKDTRIVDGKEEVFTPTYTYDDLTRGAGDPKGGDDKAQELLDKYR